MPSDSISHTPTLPPASSPTRREVLQGSLAVAGAAVASSLAPSVLHAQPAARRPNLIFFLGEGQRADALSIAGNPVLKTPHHDRIGREGVRFQNAFCTNALCAPARAVALSGMYSRSTGALSNMGLKNPLPSDIPLFTDLLRQAGYEIALVGKVHGRNGFEERHWDYYFGHNDPANNYNNPFFKEGRNGQVGPQQQFHNIYADDLAVDRALAWLEEDRGDKPFCLLVWFVAPHEPFFRPRRHFDLYDNGTVIPRPATFHDDRQGYPGKPKGFIDATNKIGVTYTHPACGSLEGIAKDYYAGLVAVDDNIGRIFSYLEKKNILDDTAIVQTSDHGYFLGEFGCFDKRFMHEPSIRVPLQMRYPRRVPAGTVRDEMVLDIDLAPTFLDLAGLPVPAQMQGKSLIPLAKADDPDFRREWYYEYYEWPNPETVPPHRGIRTDRYKLIHYVPPAGVTELSEEFELYDLKSDPNETHNLYGHPDYAVVQKRLLERCDAMRAAVPERHDGTQV